MTYTLIPGQSHTASEEETLSMIRSVLTEEDTAPKAETTADAPVADEPSAPRQRAFVEPTPAPAPRRRSTDLPDLAEVEVTAPRASRVSRLLTPAAGLIQRVRGFQPTTRHIALALSALLFVLRPHWFVIGAVLSILLLAGLFLTLGADRIWRGVLAWLDRVEARNPARASDLRDRLDRFAYRWDGVLDIFPDGMVDSLYMPDFQAMQRADIDHQTVVSDRLDRMAQEG